MAYWRGEPWEVDAVVTGSWGRWRVEVKLGRFAAGALAGRLEFVRRFPAYRPLVVCDADLVDVATRAGVQAFGWEDFLRTGLPDAT